MADTDYRGHTGRSRNLAPFTVRVKSLPVNAKRLFLSLFAGPDIACEPGELLFDPVILDTRCRFLGHFERFALLLAEKGVPLYVVCDFDPGMDISSLTAFPHIFLIDLDVPPSEYDLLKEAVRRAILSTLPADEIWHLPRFLAFGYTELKVRDGNIEDTKLVIDLQRERFVSCGFLTAPARALGQTKRFLTCPPNLERTLSGMEPPPVFLHRSERRLRNLNLYWLDDDQMHHVLGGAS